MLNKIFIMGRLTRDPELRHGDKTNISLDNLLLITDAQMARLNKSGFVKVDKDLTVASLLVCDVISKTARRKEEMTRGKKHEKNC